MRCLTPLAASLMGLVGAAQAQTALPFDVGGAYALVDHHGQPHTQMDPDGHPQLLFFGYANCPGICSVALPMMGQVADLLADQGIALRPVMITVDPARDRVGTMGAPLARHHPDFVGLTGTPEALAVAYKAFSVNHALAYQDPTHGPVYSHGALIYLLDGAGTVLTLFPPVMDGSKAAEVARRYLAPQE